MKLLVECKVDIEQEDVVKNGSCVDGQWLIHLYRHQSERIFSLYSCFPNLIQINPIYIFKKNGINSNKNK